MLVLHDKKNIQQATFVANCSHALCVSMTTNGDRAGSDAPSIMHIDLVSHSTMLVTDMLFCMLFIFFVSWLLSFQLGKQSRDDCWAKCLPAMLQQSAVVVKAGPTGWLAALVV